MANEIQNLTNPNDLVDVSMLDYFKQRTDSEYAPMHHLHSEKADKVGSGHNNELATFNNNGNLKPSGKSADDILIPINIEDVTPTTTFLKNSTLGIDGVMFRAIRDTDEFPVVLLVEDGHIVYDEDEEGRKAFVVSDWTQSDDWEIWSDASIPRTLDNMTAQQEAFMTNEQADMAAFKTEIRNDAAALLVIANQSIKPGTKITSSGGTQYTVQQLLEAMAELMNKKIVADPIE